MLHNNAGSLHVLQMAADDCMVTIQYNMMIPWMMAHRMSSEGVLTEKIVSGQQKATLQPEEQKQIVLKVVCCQLDCKLGKAVAN